MSSCFSPPLRLFIAIRNIYYTSVSTTTHLLLPSPDFHHGLLAMNRPEGYEDDSTKLSGSRHEDANGFRFARERELPPVLPACGFWFYAWSRRATRCDERYGRGGRECHRRWWRRRFARATGSRVTARSGWWNGSDSVPRRSPRSRGAPVPTAEPWPSHRRPAHRRGPSEAADCASCRRPGRERGRETAPSRGCRARDSHRGRLYEPGRKLRSFCRSRWGR